MGEREREFVGERETKTKRERQRGRQRPEREREREKGPKAVELIVKFSSPLVKVPIVFGAIIFVHHCSGCTVEPCLYLLPMGQKYLALLERWPE